MNLGSEVRADVFELEANGWLVVWVGQGDGYVEVTGKDAGFGNALFVGDAAEVVQRRTSARFTDDVFLPARDATIRTEEMSSILRVVLQTKLLVRYCEHGRREMFIIRFSLAANASCAPATIDEFPLAVIDFDGVPGVALGLRRDGGAWRQG